MKYINLIIICLWSLSLQSDPASTQLKIFVNGMESDDGQLILDIYTNKKGFLHSETAIKRLITSIKNGVGTFTIRDLPVGEYAFTFHHDENNNGEIDANWFGLPKEGLAVSNNAKGFFGPPSYEDAKFSLKRGESTMSVTIKYL